MASTALDIGTWGGPIAFELERRGAITTAIDIRDPDQTGFNTAKEILSSQVTYLRENVYNLMGAVSGPFDIVVFAGVYYHLRDPVLAFEQIWNVLADDGVIHFEGEIAATYAERLEGSRNESLDVAAIAQSDSPICFYYPGRYMKGSNWIVPNLAAVKSWLLAAGLKLVKHDMVDLQALTDEPTTRIRGIATKHGRPRKKNPNL